MAAPKREQQRKNSIIELIRKHTFTYGYNLSQVAELAGMCEATFYSRMKNPGRFSLDEINRIARAIHIPAAELSPILTWVR